MTHWYIQISVSADQEGISTQEDGGRCQFLEAKVLFLLSVAEDLGFYQKYPLATINSQLQPLASEMSLLYHYIFIIYT